jgi:L-amino acid N-acyltransferase YncA
LIRRAIPQDATAIAEIYNFYVTNSVITFDEVPISPSDILTQIEKYDDSLPWLVYEENNEICGYAYASNWKSRCAYKQSIESTIYLSNHFFGKGIGTKLYEALINELKKQDYHAIIGGISLPNEGSIALHEKLGFEKVAQFKEVGYKFDQWIDVGYWELII